MHIERRISQFRFALLPLLLSASPTIVWAQEQSDKQARGATEQSASAVVEGKTKELKAKGAKPSAPVSEPVTAPPSAPVAAPTQEAERTSLDRPEATEAQAMEGATGPGADNGATSESEEAESPPEQPVDDPSEVEVRVVGVADQPAAPRNLQVDPRALPNTMPTRLSRWSVDPARFFVSARVDFGYLFFRPRASLGYGKPHQHWGGLDVVPILSAGQGGAYSGLRYRHPRFEIRSGMLYSAAFSRTYLPPADSFDALDLETEIGDTASYLAWDSEMKFSFKLGYGYLFAETQSIFMLGLDDDQYVFVDTLGIIMAPPWAGRQQLGYSLAIPGIPNLYVGPSVEFLYSPDRTEPLVVRAGAEAIFWLYRDLQLRTEVMPTVYGPDTLGRIGSSWLSISARFMWATDDGSKFRKK